MNTASMRAYPQGTVRPRPVVLLAALLAVLIIALASAVALAGAADSISVALTDNAPFRWG